MATRFEAWLVSQTVTFLSRRYFVNNKQWWASKTLWGILVSIIATAFQLFGVVNISDIEQGQLTDKIIVLADLIAQFIGFVLAIYGRIVAKHNLTGK